MRFTGSPLALCLVVAIAVALTILVPENEERKEKEFNPGNAVAKVEKPAEVEKSPELIAAEEAVQAVELELTAFNHGLRDREGSMTEAENRIFQDIAARRDIAYKRWNVIRNKPQGVEIADPAVKLRYAAAEMETKAELQQVVVDLVTVYRHRPDEDTMPIDEYCAAFAKDFADEDFYESDRDTIFHTVHQLEHRSMGYSDASGIFDVMLPKVKSPSIVVLLCKMRDEWPNPLDLPELPQ